MNLEQQMTFLRRTPKVLPLLMENLTDRQFRWKPPSGNWSILEILGHMLAEERHDFRLRVKLTLDSSGRPWPAYDPEGIVVSEEFNKKNPASVLAEFVKERSESVSWLEQLKSPNWDLAYQHPRIGQLRVGDLFVSWVAHDQLHVRQIAKRCFEMISEDGFPYETRYAGQW